MGVKRKQVAQTASQAKKSKADLFKASNLPSTSSASEPRQLDKQDSEPHGGQLATESQDSLDNAPMTISCLTLAETAVADEQPLVKRPAVIEVDEPDTDKESHIVLQEMAASGRIPDTQIDMTETTAGDMHIGEPEETPRDIELAIEKAEDMPDGFTTPPRAQLRELMAAVDGEDGDACTKFFEKLAGTQKKIDKDSADSLEANFEDLAGKFAELDPAKLESKVDPKIAKKMEDLEAVVESNKLDAKSSLGIAFRREHKHDPQFHSMGRVEAQKYKLQWAGKRLSTLATEHTKSESFSRVDSTKGVYKNFGQLVMSQGGICMRGPKNMGPQY